MGRTRDGGDHRADETLRDVDIASLRPKRSDIAPDGDWGPAIPSAADLYLTYDPDIASAAISALTHISRSEPAITADVVAAAPTGCRVHGLEYRMKSPAALAAKIAKKSRELPYPSPEEVSTRLADVIRYTIVAPRGGEIVPTAVTMLSQLVKNGWAVRELEHSFVEGNPYKGLHAVVRDPGTSQDIEIQFHSEQGITIKEAQRSEYELMRDPNQPRSVRAAAFDRMAAAWGTVNTPDGVAAIEVAGVRVRVKVYRNLYRRH